MTVAYKKPVFQVFEDTSGQWRWRLRARNGEIVAQSEGYKSVAGARRGAIGVKATAAAAEVAYGVLRYPDSV